MTLRTEREQWEALPIGTVLYGVPDYMLLWVYVELEKYLSPIVYDF